jgi:hypothetical protein
MTKTNDIPKFEYGFYSDSLNECYKKFGGIFKLPIIYNPYQEMILQYQKGNILDIGAGKEKPLFNAIKDKLTSGKYYSLDTDPKGIFDFNSIENLPKDLQFSLITANQVFEHLDIQESINMMCTASFHLESKGKIIATVPNIAHPNRQISNITHITPWGFNSFYMVFKYANLDVTKIARYSKRHPAGIIEKLIAKYISRIYRMDWCDSILMIGMKSGK